MAPAVCVHSMQALARRIRTRHYQHLLSEIDDEDIDENQRVAVDQAWIDRQDRAWQRQRELRQTLEYRCSDPADAGDLAAARRFCLGCSVRTTEAERIARWERAYAEQRQALQDRLQRLRALHRRMDPALSEYDRCAATMQDLHVRLAQLSHHVKIPTA